jgi:putative colanic acid biosynthesis acetyltransferase WcaF
MPKAFVNLEIEKNRQASKYSNWELVLRVFWSLALLIFQCTPRPCFALRRWILRCFGATVGREVHIYPSARVYYPWKLRIDEFSSVGEDVLIYNLGWISIGARTTISHRSHLCAGTHDYSDPTLPLLKPPITVGSDVWICSDAFVGPGVTIGDGAIVGARAVVFKDVEPLSIVIGNPAQHLKYRVMDSNKKTC